MSVFLADPSVLTKDKLKSVLVANNVALPDGEQRKGVYVQLYLRNLTCRNTASGAAGAFSSDEELQPEDTTASRSGRKATKKTDRVPPEEMDVTVLTNEDLKGQLLKYGVSAGPIVASTRKVYEKRLQKLLDQGGSDTTPPRAKCTQTGSGYNGTTQHAEQYSDMEGETTPADPDPVPVVERPVRSRGKPSVTPRTLGSRHRTEQEDEPEGDLQVWDVWRKSRRSSRRLDQAVPAGDDADISEMLPVPHERGRDRPLAVPRVPTPLLADEPESSPVRGDSWTEPRRSRMHLAHCARDGFQEKLRGKGLISSSDWCAEMQPSLLNTALLEDGPDSQALSPRSLEARAADTEQKRVPLAKRQTEHRSASTPPSRDLLHVMCRLSPLSTSPHLLSVMDSSPKPPSTHLLMVSTNLPAQQDPLPVTQSSSKERAGSSVAQSIGRQSHSGPSLSPVLPPSGRGSGVLIEKLSCIEQTPKVTERNVLKEMFSSESLNTPTGISATCRRPIKGAAGRPVSDVWLGDLRPRLTEIRRSSSSYTESRSVPRVSAVPFTPSRPMAPPAVQAKARRRVPVWVRLLLLSAVAGFLFLVYQAMETNEMSPFGHGGSNALDSK